MSKRIWQEQPGGLSVTAFYGGTRRGAMLQFTTSATRYAQLGPAEVERLVVALRSWLDGRR